MKFFERKKPLNNEENEMTDQENLDSLREVMFSNKNSKPVKGQRRMLCISSIDPVLKDILKKRAEARGIPLYEYCSILLVLAMEVEDMMTKPARKSRKTSPDFRKNTLR